MEPEAVWGERWARMEAPIARRYMSTAARSRSLVCLAADRPTVSGILELVVEVGPHLAALKTHVDLVTDWTEAGWEKVRAAADEADLLLFEDRKFADIGGITQKQMHGVYGIAGWADLVTAHLISGPDIVDGCMAAWADVGRNGGVLLRPKCPAVATCLRVPIPMRSLRTGTATTGSWDSLETAAGRKNCVICVPGSARHG